MELHYIHYKTIDQNPLDESTLRKFVSESGHQMIGHDFDEDDGMIIFDSPITKIERNALLGQTTLKEIYLPDTVKVIDAFAFACCYNLDYIQMPSVESIEDFAFLDCNSLLDITIRQNVKKLGTNAFSGCPDRHSIYINNTCLSYKDIKKGFGALYHGNVSLSIRIIKILITRQSANCLMMLWFSVFKSKRKGCFKKHPFLF